MADDSQIEQEGGPVRIDLVNLSERSDKELLAFMQDVIDELQLTEDVRFIFQRQWTAIDDEGNIIEGTERDVAFDGDATYTNTVRICLSKTLTFPLMWNINPALEGGYIRNVNFFNDEDEFLVYFLGHECRHLWQWQNEFQAKLIYQMLECDAETDADIFATRTLSRYRQREPSPSIEDI